MRANKLKDNELSRANVYKQKPRGRAGNKMTPRGSSPISPNFYEQAIFKKFTIV